jgi:hypothetical protein
MSARDDDNFHGDIGPLQAANSPMTGRADQIRERNAASSDRGEPEHHHPIAETDRQTGHRAHEIWRQHINYHAIV